MDDLVFKKHIKHILTNIDNGETIKYVTEHFGEGLSTLKVPYLTPHLVIQMIQTGAVESAIKYLYHAEYTKQPLS